MASLEDRARANAARERENDEKRERSRAAHLAEERAKSPDPRITRSRAALAELVTFARGHRVAPFPLYRLMQRPRQKREGFRRVTYYELVFEQIEMAWVLGSVSVGHVSPEPFVAVTESLRLFEVVTLMRPSPGVAMQAIYSISAMDFYGVPRSECAVPDSGLQADTDMPSKIWK